MQEPISLTDETLDSVLMTDKPVLLLISNGDGVRADFATAFKKAASEQNDIIFAQIDPVQNPQAAQRFGAAGKPLLVGWYCGESVVRRSRPWGTDVPLALEQVRMKVADLNPDAVPAPVEEAEESKQALVLSAPIAVTDQTFEQEVIHSPLPVLVDFWAEWCGPCRMVAPVLDKLAKEFAGKIRITKVNVDENPRLSATFGIQSIPTLMMVKNRTIVFSQPGALPEPTLRDLIQQLIKLEVPDPQPEQGQES